MLQTSGAVVAFWFFACVLLFGASIRIVHATTSGPIIDVWPSGRVLTGAGRGSDDKGGEILATLCEANINGSIDTAGCYAVDSGQACNGAGGSNRTAYCSSGVLTGWQWHSSAQTDGGAACDNSGTPSNACHYQNSQELDTNTNRRKMGSELPYYTLFTNGTCPDRGYTDGSMLQNILHWNSSDPWMMPNKLYVSIGDDAGFGSVTPRCTTLNQINPPQNLDIVAGSPVCEGAVDSLELSWDDAGADQYLLKTVSGTVTLFTLIPDPNDRAGFKVSSLTPGVNYTFEVMGIYGGQGGPNSGSQNCLNGNLDFDPVAQTLTCTGGATPIQIWSSTVNYTANATCNIPAVCVGDIGVLNPGDLAVETCFGQSGTSTIEWTSAPGCANAKIVYTDNGGPEQNFVDPVTPGISENKKAEFIRGGHTYVFKLKNNNQAVTSTTFGVPPTEVTVTGADLVCVDPNPVCVMQTYYTDPSAVCMPDCSGDVVANPSSGPICSGAGQGQTQVTWTASATCDNATAEVWEVIYNGSVAPGNVLSTTLIGTGCNSGAPVSRNVQLGHINQYQINMACPSSGSPLQTWDYDYVIPSDACGGCGTGVCSGTFPNAICDTSSCTGGVGEKYSVTYAGPGPESDGVVGFPLRETWFKNAGGQRWNSDGTGNANCSGTPPSAPSCLMTIGGEIEFTLNFVDPFTLPFNITCVSPGAPDNCRVLPGQPATFSVTLNNGTNGFTGIVNLSAIITGLSFSGSWPGGAQCNFPAPSQNCTKTFVITPAAGSSASDYQLFVRATIPGLARVDSNTWNFEVWNFDFSISPSFGSGPYLSTLTFTIDTWGLNGFTKGLKFDGPPPPLAPVIFPVTNPAPTFVSGNPLFTTASTPASPAGTFDINLTGLCGTTYTATVRGTTTSGATEFKERTTQFRVDNAPPVLTLAASVCTGDPDNAKRTIDINFGFVSDNSLTLERSTNPGFSTVKSYAVPAGVTGCTDTNDTDGGGSPECGSDGPGIEALAAPGQQYYYRLTGNACGGGNVTSPTLSVPSPDCRPTASSSAPTATITSWCSPDDTQPDVSGSVSWSFCDPDASNFASCASQTAPTFAFDTQGAFQVQIDNNSNFSSPEVDSGTITGPASSWSWPVGLNYLQQYFYRVRVRDANNWGGSDGVGGSAPRWSEWSCLPPNCTNSFIQDHFFGGLAYTPLAPRTAENTPFFASVTLYNDDAANPVARGVHNPASPSQTWQFQFCDSGSSMATCNPVDLDSQTTSTLQTIPPPAAYGAWPVFCTSTDTATCPVDTNRPNANEGFYNTSGVSHTFPNEGLVAIAVTANDNDGHFCTYEKAVQLKPRIPSWYEVAPRY
ncbi:MAG: fibronectin type III domain-containing protein [bacterium]|nr:fibronectin type III domain-containing protein [bacterium]